MKNIKLIVYDFDGVLTDNKVIVNQNGEEAVSCNRSDGWWIQELKKKGIEQVVLSSETNPVVQARARKLGIAAHGGHLRKKDVLLNLVQEKELILEQVCFVGNDVNDLDVLRVVGLPVCPSDAIPEVKRVAKVCLSTRGGEGIVRELFDFLFPTVSPKASPYTSNLEKQTLPGSFQLSEHTALITGGAGLLGIQHGIALTESGCTVVLADLDTKRLEVAVSTIKAHCKNAEVSTIVMNVSTEESVRSAHASIFEKFGELDILINNAAIDPKVSKQSTLLEESRLENFPLESWQTQFDVGLTGAFLCSKIFGSRMASQGKGVILNIASDLSVIAPDQRLYRKEGLPEDQQPVKPVTYTVIKTALIGLTRYLAGYWANQGVRVNALSPGGVYNQQPEEFVTRLTKLIPMGRMATQEEYRGAIQFLCSDASSYMTGQNIVIDGGRSIL